jgi:hypothetical protein
MTAAIVKRAGQARQAIRRPDVGEKSSENAQR